MSVSIDVTICTSGHDVADARLHREVAALQRAGLRVEVLGLGDAAGAPPGTRARTWPRPGLAGRAALALRLAWLAQGRVLVALDPDSALGAVLRRDMGRLLGRRVRVVADVHEDYRLLLADRAWASGWKRRAGALLAELGARAAARADRVVVADDHLLAEVPDRLVLRNLPDPTMLPAPRDLDPVPRALYVGDLRRSRGLFTMLDAVSATGWELDLVGALSPVDRAEVEARLAAEPDLARRVRLHGRMPPRESWALAAGAWAGLLLLDQTPAFRAAIPSKLYEYLACGLPVVATPLPRVVQLLDETGAGTVVDGADAAAAVLMAWQHDPDSRATVAAAASAASRRSTQESEAFAEACRALAEGS